MPDLARPLTPFSWNLCHTTIERPASITSFICHRQSFSSSHTDCKPCLTPNDKSSKVSASKRGFTTQWYLRYLTVARLDPTYVVQQTACLCMHLETPINSHTTRPYIFVIYLFENSVQHQSTKHRRTRYIFISFLNLDLFDEKLLNPQIYVHLK